LERTKTVKPTFALTEQNATTVAQVCYRSNGIPLALELAAARALSVPGSAAMTAFVQAKAL
jgi:predicted ATPase